MVSNDTRREILLVEDNPGDAALTRKVLKELTDTVNATVAPDGQRACPCSAPARPGAPT